MLIIFVFGDELLDYSMVVELLFPSNIHHLMHDIREVLQDFVQIFLQEDQEVAV